MGAGQDLHDRVDVTGGRTRLSSPELRRTSRRQCDLPQEKSSQCQI